MSESGSRLIWLHDPRLAPLAVNIFPAWFWSLDATHVYWANPTGAAIFGAPMQAALSTRRFDSGQPAAAQVARLAQTLVPGAPPRLERLRGFGAGVGRALTCQCMRITLADGNEGILIAAAERAGPDLPLSERLRRLLAGGNVPLAAFAADGTLAYMPAAAGVNFAGAASLSAIGAHALATQALEHGHAVGDSTIGPLTLQRLGDDTAPILIATIGADNSTTAPTHVATETTRLHEAPVDQAVEHGALATDGAEPQPELAAIIEGAGQHAAPAADVFERHRGPVIDAPESDSEPLTIEALPEPRTDEPPSVIPAPPVTPDPPPPERRHPLRFVWQIDAEGRFTIGSDEFVNLIGPRTAALLGNPWRDIDAALGLDPNGQIEHAIATHDTWSGLSATWPVDDLSERLLVELSALPVFDRGRVFRGYRGFGVCRDLARLSALARARHAAAATAAATAAAACATPPAVAEALTTPTEHAPVPDHTTSAPVSAADEEPDATFTPPSGENVVLFRTAAPEPPTLSTVERRAFRELSRRLTERLTAATSGYEAHADADPSDNIEDPLFGPDSTLADLAEAAKAASEPSAVGAEADPALLEVELLDEAEPMVGVETLFDRFPLGVLIYRLNELHYANRAFLDWASHETIASLAEAGGLDSLFIAPGALALEEGEGKPFKMASPRAKNPPAEARLFLVPWEGDSAFALVTTVAEQGCTPDETLAAAQAKIAELTAILDAATDGVVILDRTARIVSSNRRAQSLFGYDESALAGLPFNELFAPQSLDVAIDYLDALQNNGVASVLSEGREVIGRDPHGGFMPLVLTMGRVAETNDKFCAVFRDITKWKKAEEELIEARHQAEKQSSAKSDFLAKISHEIRTPLNAIIGFSEVMMEERFGPVGNDRYRQYLKDIHASGGHLISLINDLLALSKIEAGKLELSFTGVGLNDLTQQCVAIMQPQANRERIIIRSSLAPKLPQVVADARSVRQIVLNLLSNSIKFTGAGGQVIVATALTDAGEVVLRVRDTGTGMSEQDLAHALEPFRQLATSTRFGSGGTGLGLPLTKALAAANRASFHIKSTPGAGTLAEITFPATRVLAE